MVVFVSVLKAVETVGLRHIKGSEEYRNEMEKVLRSFPGGVARAVCRAVRQRFYLRSSVRVL